MAPGQIVRAQDRVAVWHQADYDGLTGESTPPKKSAPPKGEIPTPADKPAGVIPNSNKFKGPANSLKKMLETTQHPSKGWHAESTQAVQDWADKNQAFTKSYFKPDYAEAIKAHVGPENYDKLHAHGASPITDPLKYHKQLPAPKSNKWAPAKSLKTLLDSPHTQASHVQDWVAKYPGFASTYFKPGYTDALKSSLGTKNYDELLKHLDDSQHSQLTGQPKPASEKTKGEQIGEQLEKHLGPAGLHLKTEDQFWKDHGGPDPTPTKKPLGEKFEEATGNKYGPAWHMPVVDSDMSQMHIDSDFDDDPELQEQLQQIHDEHFGTSQGEPSEVSDDGDAYNKITDHLDEFGWDVEHPKVQGWINGLTPQQAKEFAHDPAAASQAYSDFDESKAFDKAKTPMADDYGPDDDEDEVPQADLSDLSDQTSGIYDTFTNGVEPWDGHKADWMQSVMNKDDPMSYVKSKYPAAYKKWKATQGDQDDIKAIQNDLSGDPWADPEQQQQGDIPNWAADHWGADTGKEYPAFAQWAKGQGLGGFLGDNEPKELLQEYLKTVPDTWSMKQPQQQQEEEDPGTQHPALVGAVAKLFPNATGPDNTAVAHMTDMQIKGMLESWLKYLPDHEGFATHVPQIQALYDQYFGQKPSQVTDVTDKPLDSWSQQPTPDHPIPPGAYQVQPVEWHDPDFQKWLQGHSHAEAESLAYYPLDAVQQWHSEQSKPKPDVASVLSADIFSGDNAGTSLNHWLSKSPSDQKKDMAQLAQGTSLAGFPLEPDLQAKWQKAYQQLYGEEATSGGDKYDGGGKQAPIVGNEPFDADIFFKEVNKADPNYWGPGGFGYDSLKGHNPAAFKQKLEDILNGGAVKDPQELAVYKDLLNKYFGDDSGHGGYYQDVTNQPSWLADSPYKEHYPEYLKLPGEIPDDPHEAEADFHSWASSNHPETNGLPPGFKAWAEDGGVPLSHYSESELTNAMKSYTGLPNNEKQPWIDQQSASQGGYARALPSIEKAMDDGKVTMAKYKIMKTPVFKKWFEEQSPKFQQDFFEHLPATFNEFKYQDGDYDNDFSDQYNKALDQYEDNVETEEWSQKPPANTKGVDVNAINKGLEDIYGGGIEQFDPHQTAEQIKKKLEGETWLKDYTDSSDNLAKLQKLYEKHFGPGSSYSNFQTPSGGEAWDGEAETYDPLKKPTTESAWQQFGQMMGLTPNALNGWKNVSDDFWPTAIQGVADKVADKPGGYPTQIEKGIKQWMGGGQGAPAEQAGEYPSGYQGPPLEWLKEHYPDTSTAQGDASHLPDWFSQYPDSAAAQAWKEDSFGDIDKYQIGKQPQQGIKVKPSSEVAETLKTVGILGPDGHLNDKAIQYLTQNHDLGPNAIKSIIPGWDTHDWAWALNEPGVGDKWSDFSGIFSGDKPAAPSAPPSWGADKMVTPTKDQLMTLEGMDSQDADILSSQSPLSFWKNFDTAQKSINGGSTYWGPNDAWHKIVKAVEGQGKVTQGPDPNAPPVWDSAAFASEYKSILPQSGSSLGSPGVSTEKALQKLTDLISQHPGTPESNKLQKLKDKWFAKGMPTTPGGGSSPKPSAHPLALKFPGVFDKQGNPSPGFKSWFTKAKGIELDPDLAQDMAQKLQKDSGGSYWHGLAQKYMDDAGEASAISGQQDDIDTEPAKPFKSEPLKKEDLKNWAGSKPSTDQQWKQFSKWWGNTQVTPKQEQGLYKAWFGQEVSPEKAGNWFQQLFEYNSNVGEGDLGDDIPNWAHNSWAFGKNAEQEWPVFKEWAAKDSGIPKGTTLAQKVQIWNGLDDSEKSEIGDNYAPADKVDTGSIVQALQDAYPDSNFDKWKELGQGSLKKSLENLAKNGYGPAVQLFNDNFGGSYEMPEEPEETDEPQEKPTGPTVPGAKPYPADALPEWAKDYWGTKDAPQEFANFLSYAKSMGQENAAMTGKMEGQQSYYSHPIKLMQPWNQFPPHIKGEVGAMEGATPWNTSDSSLQGLQAAKQKSQEWLDQHPKMEDDIKAIVGDGALIPSNLKGAHPTTSGYGHKYQSESWKSLLAQHPDEPEHSALAALYQKFYGLGKDTLAEDLKAFDPSPAGIKGFTNWDDWLATHNADDALKLMKKKLKAPGDAEKFIGYANAFTKHFEGPSGHKAVNESLKYNSSHAPLDSGPLKQLHKWFSNGNTSAGLPYMYSGEDYDHGSPFITAKEAEEAAGIKKQMSYPSYVGWSPPVGVGEGSGYKADPAYFAESGKKKNYTAPEMAETGELKELQDNAKKWEPEKWDPSTFLAEYKKAVPGLQTKLTLSDLKNGTDKAKQEVSSVLRDYPDLPFHQRQKLEGLSDKYFRNSALSEKDKITLKTPAFKQWFSKAPKKYRQVMKLHPGIAIDDYEGFLQGHDLYPDVPEGPGKKIDYKLMPEHFVPKGDSSHKVTFPSGHSEKHNPAKAFDSQHEDSEVNKFWPGFSKNPMRPDSIRQKYVGDEVPPESAGQLELMLPPGERIEPPHKPVELHRGVGLDLNKYESSPPVAPSKHLEQSNPDAYRQQVSEYHKKLHRKYLLDQIRSRFVGSSDSAGTVPDLFNTYEDKDTPKQEVPDEWKYHGPQGMEGMFSFNKWAQDNKVPPEQMYELAKKWGVNDPNKYGTPPLSEGPWGKPMDPDKSLEADPRFAQLILDYLEAEDYYQSGWGFAPPGSLGDHWSATPNPEGGAPDSFATNGQLKVLMTGDWGGLGENPNGAHAMVGFGNLGHGENEINLSPGAPINIKRLRLRAPEHGWSSYREVPVNPHTRYAATKEALDPHKPQHLFHLAVNWGIADPERYGMAPQDPSTRNIEAAINLLAGWDDYDEYEGPQPKDPNKYQRPTLPRSDQRYYSPQGMNPESTSPARPYRSDTGGSWPDEHEVTMLPGTNMNVDSVKIQHPRTKQWHEVLQKPAVHQAMTVRKRNGILSHAEMRS